MPLSNAPDPALREAVVRQDLGNVLHPIVQHKALEAKQMVVTGGEGSTIVDADGTEYLDGKFTYELSEHLSAFVEAQNLTGETETAFAGSIRVNELSYSGKRFFVGATYKY